MLARATGVPTPKAAGEARDLHGDRVDEESHMKWPWMWMQPDSSDTNSWAQDCDSSGKASDSSSSCCDSTDSENSANDGKSRPTESDGCVRGGTISRSGINSSDEWEGLSACVVTNSSDTYLDVASGSFDFDFLAPVAPPGGVSRSLCGDTLVSSSEAEADTRVATQVLPTEALPPPPAPALAPPPHSFPCHPVAPACCPFCQSVPYTAQLATNEELTHRKFARYRQRRVARKNNRLAAWFCKYGYVGPAYCKACSEKFSSHLLRQNANSATRVTGPKGRCSRSAPCEACVMILSNFNVPPQELFCKYDSRPSKRRQPHHSTTKRDAAKGTGNEESRVVMDRLLTEADGSHTNDSERPGKKRRSIPALFTLATIVSFWGLVRYIDENRNGTPMTTPLDQSSWKCGDEMSSLVDEAVVHSACSGADPSTLFACSVNDCAAAGMMPIGQRVCRCDGCYKPGRCGGWILQGHSMGSMVETGRECSRFEVSPRPRASRANWRLPMELDCTTCTQFAAQEYAQPKCSASSCELSSVWAWPQPVAGAEEVAPTYPEYYSPTVREGVIWSDGRDGAATLWLYNVQTPAELMPPGFAAWIDSGTNESGIDEVKSSDVHQIWKFAPADGVWLPQNSSIGSAPHPKSLSGAGSWTDMSGSLFLFGGIQLEESAAPGDKPLVDMNTAGWMWRYDTHDQKWEPLGPRFTALDTVYSRQRGKRGSPGARASKRLQGAAHSSGGPMPTWPANRVRATIWVDYSPEATTVGAIWMFGGSGDTTTNKCSNCTWSSWLPVASGTSELWRYQYEHHARSLGAIPTDLPSTTVSGTWQLVSMQEAELRSRTGRQTAAQIQPTQLCTDPTRPGVRGPADYGFERTRQCPEGRVDAGSWASTSGQPGGWIFGGMAISHDAVQTRGQLRDLWQFSAVKNPSRPAATVVGRWRQVAPAREGGQRVSLWPPAWSGPKGWVDTQGNGSLWISGETGQQHDVVPICTTSYDGASRKCSTIMGEIDADSSKQNSDLWRFDLGSERWEHIQASDGFGTSWQAGWRTPRPAKRQRAVLSLPGTEIVGSRTPGMFMLGGIGMKECSDGGSDNDDRTIAWDTRASSEDESNIELFAGRPSGLTGLWRWEEAVSE